MQASVRRREAIVLVAHSSTFDERMPVRLRSMCDGYLGLHVQSTGAKLLNMLEVRKVLNAERPTGNVVYNPFSRANA